jgi:hypothetical protein
MKNIMPNGLMFGNGKYVERNEKGGKEVKSRCRLLTSQNECV